MPMNPDGLLRSALTGILALSLVACGSPTSAQTDTTAAEKTEQTDGAEQSAITTPEVPVDEGQKAEGSDAAEADSANATSDGQGEAVPMDAPGTQEQSEGPCTGDVVLR
jgi:hypothetical protein